ncbi:MAG: hypothetical protein KDD67_07400 [Ignavibacteriae bacterium]|nr:hypothetical protein [Ignavibacteriota bacterium]MCB9217273.1 hypothetical protein [Ignavibacteria bacterium]
MFTQEQHAKLNAIATQEELIPVRLRDHSLPLIAEILENGRSQRFFSSEPLKDVPGVDHKELVNAVRELRWEGFVDIEKDDIDDDGILDDIHETGWTTNDSGIEFLRRLKQAAGFS